jgi:predicted nucleic acid-binding protein
VRHGQRVFIDTSELFPFTIMDLLLNLSEDLLFTWVWTDEVIQEWERVIVREGMRTPASAAAVGSAVRHYFGQGRIDPGVYRAMVTDDLSPDPDDRVHAAAVIHGHVDVLLTRNLKDLRTAPVLSAGVAVMTADEFLSGLLESFPRAVMDAFVRLAAEKRSPRLTSRELSKKLAVAGAPLFADRLVAYLPE